jgi:predicted nicotinamide N-methyase
VTFYDQSHGDEAKKVPGSDWIEWESLAPPDRDPSMWVTEELQIGERTLKLARPREPDRLLDDHGVACASRTDDYMPYWAYVWPAALPLAEIVMREHWRPGTRVLEIGCGLGLAGLAALARGHDVTFSDYSPAALAMASHNARLNEFTRYSARLLDWREPASERFDVILGADVLYEQRCLEQVLDVVDEMLVRGGFALITDPDRTVAGPFADLARARGLDDVVSDTALVSVEGRVRAGKLHRLTHRE